MLDNFVSGKNSMIQKLDNSHDLRRMYTTHCNELAGSIETNRSAHQAWRWDGVLDNMVTCNTSHNLLNLLCTSLNIADMRQ